MQLATLLLPLTLTTPTSVAGLDTNDVAAVVAVAGDVNDDKMFVGHFAIHVVGDVVVAVAVVVRKIDNYAGGFAYWRH